MKSKIETQKTTTSIPIEYHADDFGMFQTQSRRILECYENGTLNGVSVMPNSSALAECMKLLQPVKQDVSVTIHLNIIEGRSLTAAEEVPLLTYETGVFRVSFGSLLLHSYLPGRKAYREQLKKELRAQIHAVRAYLTEDLSVRLDGHAHYHMLPVVFDALMDVIREDNLDVSYIRIPREYPSLYLRHLREIQDFSAINLVKVLILNLLSLRNRRKYAQVLDTMEQRLFLGVFLSGRMYRENVEPVIPEAIALAQRQGKGIEILAHPGGVYEKADIDQLTNQEDIEFLTSEFRRKEKTMFEPMLQ